MKKKICCSLMIGLAFGLTSCGSKSEDATTSESLIVEDVEADVSEAEASDDTEYVISTYEDSSGFCLSWYSDFYDSEEDDGIKLIYNGDDKGNYANFYYTDDKTLEELLDYIKSEANDENLETITYEFGDTGIESNCISYGTEDGGYMQVNVLPYKDGNVVVESYSYGYEEDDMMAIQASSMIELVVNNLELPE